VSYLPSAQRLQTIEDSFDDNGASIYAETRPFIITLCSFDNIQTDSGSVMFIAENPMIVIQDNNFTNSGLNDASLQLGGYINMATDQTAYLTSTNIISHDSYFSPFNLAEDIMLQNFPDFQALFSSGRSSVSSYDHENSIYFILLQNIVFSNITVSSGQSFLSINDFEINNGTILINRITIEVFSLLSTSAFSLFRSESVS
jgi:hypothetical protein